MRLHDYLKLITTDWHELKVNEAGIDAVMDIFWLEVAFMMAVDVDSTGV